MAQIAQKLERDALEPWFTKPRHDHVAQFYTDEQRLSACALEYVYSGLLRREMCIVVATPEKLITLQKGLRRLGVDISALLVGGYYITYDAEELLTGLMNNREIDTPQLGELAAKLTRHITSAKQRVRIFGEMAAVLRRQKNLPALTQLEHAFDELLHRYDFSLYCAYPAVDQSGESIEMHQKAQKTHDHIFYC
jgi:hypothetical protein